MFPAEPKEVREERNRQYDALQAFLSEWTRDAEENDFRGAVDSCRTRDEFEEMLEIKLRMVVQRRLVERAAASVVDGESVPGTTGFRLRARGGIFREDGGG